MKRHLVTILFSLLFGWLSLCTPALATVAQPDLQSTVEALSQWSSRAGGAAGSDAAADYIVDQLQAMGLTDVGQQRFALPARHHVGSRIQVLDTGRDMPVEPIDGNAITPESTGPEGISGPLIYAGRGELNHFNGQRVEGAIVLMELESADNWLNAAALGAKALIYVDRGNSARHRFAEKQELSPIHFPRFWLPLDKANELFGNFTTPAPRQVRLVSDIYWMQSEARNIHVLIPGSDDNLKHELVLIEAFYDAGSWVMDRAPGADEALGIASWLGLARQFASRPPARSVLLVASAGHTQSLAGMRELIWTLTGSSRELRNIKKSLSKSSANYRRMIDILQHPQLDGSANAPAGADLHQAVANRLKTEVDQISRQLMALRLQRADQGAADAQTDQRIKQLADRRLKLRRLGWNSNLTDLAAPEQEMLHALIPLALTDYQTVLKTVKIQQNQFKSAMGLRRQVADYELISAISLHLSSHGNGFGAFHRGWLYDIKPEINRIGAYSTFERALTSSAAAVQADLYQDTLRPNRKRAWQSYFLDRPCLGGEVSALAGILGISLVTVNDARAWWGTPSDTVANINWEFARKQSRQVHDLIRQVLSAPTLRSEVSLPNGFATVTGRANLLRHGELFADQPAENTTIMAFQGPGRYYAQVDAQGLFHLKGVATSKFTIHKVIIEGYRFDTQTGETIWAIDKKETGKPAYRLKMRRSRMETDLIMFNCRQSTLFNLLEPRTFRYMTKIQLFDAKLEAQPLHYWWSRIDTRTSNLLTLCLEPGMRYKLTLSDSVLHKRMILTHATDQRPEGNGYAVDAHPLLIHTVYRTARDMWALLGPRITNLETHGIYDDKIRRLKTEGLGALQQSRDALQNLSYDQFMAAAQRSWALAGRVYDHVDQTQKDVLFGVLFYIALFVPFAFCMERLLFCFTHINKRIIAFCGILGLLIVVIYQVHPAFELAYSPTVVILAFFIMGLSLIVTLIIFFRFEEEMARLQRRAQQTNVDEIGRWKAFVASFLLGVSNLRRRRLRTALTCITLIILTFTIMSFTAVKSSRLHSRLALQTQPAYHGYLFKNVNWQSLPMAAVETITNEFADQAAVLPRIWLENDDSTRPAIIPVTFAARHFDAHGLVGLSAAEGQTTGMARILSHGRWFTENESQAVLLPMHMADQLGITLGSGPPPRIEIWGMPFHVVGLFAADLLQAAVGLDGEPPTPVTFPGEAAAQMSEIEMEAMESGDDVRAFQSRYQHVASDLTIIMPYRSLLSLGGELKSIAVVPSSDANLRGRAEELVDRFGLALFSGEPAGAFLYNASDALSYSGVPNILIPIIISVFIVLNTMIGSVYERKGEIGIYTSVGLAPVHVSFLFIAEALAFAVISVVLGYLLAQVSAGLFAGTALWQGITVNYSSLAGVAAMVLVIMVVLISVIYPSRVAAEIAIPDVNRSWDLPQPSGNTLALTLPFLMKFGDHRGVGGFLLDYFESHRDISHGVFSSARPRIGYLCPQFFTTSADPKDHRCSDFHRDTCLELTADVWLAPFDFGIMQQAVIHFCASVDNPGFLEIRILLERKAGEANAWLRINKAFLHQLRKQMLTWHSLTPQMQQHYRERLSVSPPSDRLEK